MLIYSSTVVTIEMQQATYNPSELNLMFPVCAVMIGQTEIPVPIILTPAVSPQAEFNPQGIE